MPSILILNDIASRAMDKIAVIEQKVVAVDYWVNQTLNRKLGLLLTSTSEIKNQFGSTEDEIKKAFTGDIVFMTQSDNMFSAFDGAKGTSLGLLSPDVKPMSFDSSFP